MLEDPQLQDIHAPRKRRRLRGTPTMPGWVDETGKARLFGKSLRQAIRERNEGRSPPYARQGARTLYRFAAIEEWLRAKEVASSKAKPAKAAGASNGEAE